MKKIYSLILTPLISSFCFGQGDFMTANNSNSRNRYEIYVQTIPAAPDASRQYAFAVKGLATCYFYTTNIYMSKFATSGDKVILANSSGNLFSQPLSDFQYTSSVGITKTGNNFTADMSVIMARSVAEDSIAAINDRMDLKAETSDVYSKAVSDGLYKPIGYVPDWTDVTGKPSFFSGAYADLTGKPTLFDGNYNNLSNLPSLFNGVFSSLSSKPTTLSGYGITDAYPISGNPSNFLTGITSGQINTALGYMALSTTGNGSSLTGITNTQVSGLGTASTQNSTAFATAAQGTKADTALQSEIDGSITNEIELPSQTSQSGKILSTNGTTPSWISYSPDQTVIITANDGLSSGGTYPNLTIGIATKTYNYTPSRTIQTVAASGNGFQISSNKEAYATYSVTVTCAVQIGVVTNVEGYIVLEVASTNSSTASDWKEVGRVTNSQNVSLAVALASTQKVGGSLTIPNLPVGYYARLRSVNVSGTPTYAANGQFEAY